MTSFSKRHKLQRQIIFDAPAAAARPVAPATGPLLARNAPQGPPQLLVPGQGTVVFKCHADPAATSPIPLWVALGSAQNPDLLRLTLGADLLRLVVNGQAEEEAGGYPMGILPDEYAYYWLSLDPHHSRVRFGIGEARVETLLYEQRLSAEECQACRAATTVYASPTVTLMRLLRDPVVTTVPLAVRPADQLTMDDIAHNRYLPPAALPPVARQLYDTISGAAFRLETEEFPDFAAAIKRSIEDPAGWCHQKLKAKQGEFGGPQEVYLRITLGHNGGESPGIPFVMEIWPPQCFSPVHQHAGANAVVRVLHGRIQVTLYPYLRPAALPSPLPAGEFPYAETVFETGEVTWVSPVLNQIHRLRNPEPLGAEPCITIQCYQYDADDAGHYPFFDFDKADDDLHQYEPDSDLDFVEFKQRMRAEWAARPLLMPA